MDTQITFEQIHNSLPNIAEDEVERTLQEASSIDWWYSTNTSSEKAQTIVYDGDYLPSDLVDECFIDNQHTFVDKTYTGNGFTFGTLNSTSTEGVTVIVAPNQEVVKSKEESDKKKGITDRSYIYEKCTDEVDMERDKIVFIVVDSFLHQKDYFIKWRDNISRILIDEAHQLAIQSAFRSNLIGFRELVDTNFPNTARVSVTATPMLFQDVDIKLVRATKREVTSIHITPNQEKSLERLRERVREGRKVLFATHDVRIIKRLIGDGKLEANFKVGTNLMRSIVEFIPNIKIDAKSNLTIISSRGFEGFDLEGIHDVFVFEDRAREYTTFYAQNVIQVSGRPREGVDYVEWCYLNNSERRKMPNREKLHKQANSKRISIEKKMSDNNYRDVRTYYTKQINYETGLADELVFNEDRYLLDEEMFLCDSKGVKEQYEDYFAERDLKLVFLDEERFRFGVKGIKPSHKTIFNNVHSNKSIVVDLKLMDDIKVPHHTQEKVEDYLKEYKVYMRRKFWNLDRLPFSLIDVAHGLRPERKQNLSLIYGSINKSALVNAWICEEFLSNEDKIDKEVSVILKNKKKHKQNELGRKSKDYKKWLEDYSVNLKDRYIRLLIALSDTEFKIAEKIRNHRDYSILVEVSMDLIEAMAYQYYDVIVTELDIRNAYVRILYALLGLELKDGFYGVKGTKERQQNKRAISKLLNSLSKEQALVYVKDDEKALKEKKSKLKAKLKQYGICEEVATYLMENYWDKHKDALFNSCAYHEKLIVEKLMEALQIVSDEIKADIRMSRRHDSVIVFGNYGREFYGVVNDFEYLSQKGWFEQQGDSLSMLPASDQDLSKNIDWIDDYEVPTEDAFGNSYDATSQLEIEF